jgi:hypothetical protein
MDNSISDKIRSFAREGVAVADIARRLGIRYQHAYKVCSDAGLLVRAKGSAPPAAIGPSAKPGLTVDTLLAGGFLRAGGWAMDGARLRCPDCVPQTGGVYAFALEEEVFYVGLASNSLAKRLYFYGNPGSGQRTNIRLNAILVERLAAGCAVEVYYACPPQLEWNGFPVAGAEGLEAGLVRRYYLPWNMKGA